MPPYDRSYTLHSTRITNGAINFVCIAGDTHKKTFMFSDGEEEIIRIIPEPTMMPVLTTRIRVQLRYVRIDGRFFVNTDPTTTYQVSRLSTPSSVMVEVINTTTGELSKMDPGTSVTLLTEDRDVFGISSVPLNQRIMIHCSNHPSAWAIGRVIKRSFSEEGICSATFQNEATQNSILIMEEVPVKRLVEVPRTKSNYPTPTYFTQPAPELVLQNLSFDVMENKQLPKDILSGKPCGC